METKTALMQPFVTPESLVMIAVLETLVKTGFLDLRSKK